MGIQFDKTFGNNAPAAGEKSEKPKAQYWLNIGYQSDVKDEETGEYRFISLAQGIPLDTMETLATNSRNAMYAAMQGARNDLRDQIIAQAEKLAPGQSVIVDEDAALQIQIRRVNEETAAPTGEANPFSRKLFAVA